MHVTLRHNDIGNPPAAPFRRFPLCEWYSGSFWLKLDLSCLLLQGFEHLLHASCFNFIYEGHGPCLQAAAAAGCWSQACVSTTLVLLV